MAKIKNSRKKKTQGAGSDEKKSRFIPYVIEPSAGFDEGPGANKTGEKIRLQTRTTLKAFEVTEKGIRPKFGKILFPSSLLEKIDELLICDSDIRLTIELIQPSLPGMDNPKEDF